MNIRGLQEIGRDLLLEMDDSISTISHLEGSTPQECKREYQREYMRRWRAANPEKSKERNRIDSLTWYKANLDKARSRERRWRLANPDKKRDIKVRRQARRLGLAVESYARRDIFERDGWKCQLCGQKINRRLRHPHPMSASIDHIVPLARGGADAPSNVHAAHLRCNQSKHIKAHNEQLRMIG